MEKHQYILRYYLPIKPHFDEEYTEKRFQELLSFCEETSTEAVMFYVALSPDWYYMPDTVEYARESRDQMLPYIKRLRAAGISYQLNFQNLVGSTLGGVDFSSYYEWENLVDHKGRESLGCGCPIGKRFREHAGERLRIWAETNPDIIWIDDDLRYHNHGTPILATLEGEKGYNDFYCFCDEHIRKFNKQNWTNYDRETLVREMEQQGEVSETRKAYLDFLNDTIVETAEWIRKTVQEVSPNTKLAQMTSKPDVHAAEGRDWNRFLSALCGEYTPIVRAHFGPYMEKDPKDAVKCYKLLAQTMAQIKEVYPWDVAYCPEIENTRFTTWAKSSAMTTFQLMLSAFMGCQGTTLSLFDLDGGAFFDEPLYGEMLKTQKEFLGKVTSLGLGECKNEGVIIPTSGQSGREYHLRQGETLETLGGKKRYIDNYLLKAGVPCRYLASREIDAKGVVALDGFSAGFLSDHEIRTILSGGVLLDGEAANILCERGFAEEIGVSDLKKQRIFVNAEVIKTFTRKDGTYIRIPSRIPVGNWYTSKLTEATKVLSEFLTPEGKKYPGMTFCENDLGGRVAIYHATKDWGDGFYTHHRIAFFKDVISYLGKGIPRIDCHSYALAVSKVSGNGERYYFIANLSTDTMTSVTINGNVVDCYLGVYGVAIYHEIENQLILIGTT